MVTDTSCQTATGADNHEEDVTCLFLERVQNQAKRLADDGIIIVDRPSGDRNQETDFLRTCLETLQSGTTYVQFDNIAFNVVSSPSSLLRLLQLADFVTSCSLSRISGEDRYSPPFSMSCDGYLILAWEESEESVSKFILIISMQTCITGF